MNADNLKLAAKELMSGEYKQVTGTYHDDVGLCAAGLMRKVVRENSASGDGHFQKFYGVDADEDADENDFEATIIHLNDDERMTFKEIGEWILDYVEKHEHPVA